MDRSASSREGTPHDATALWSHRGAWRVEDWALEMGVFRGSEPLDMVTLKARIFPYCVKYKPSRGLALKFTDRVLVLRLVRPY